MAVAVKACWAALIAASGLLLAPDAPAAAGLHWVAPAGCPSAQAVRDALAKLSAHSSTGKVTVEVERDGHTWGAHVTTAAGTRHIQGESCQAVADAVVVVLSLAEANPDDSSSADADSRAAATRVRPSGELAATSASSSPPEASGAAPPDNAPAPPAAAHSPRGFSIGAGVLTEVGLLPAPSVGPRLELAVSSNRWAIEVAAAALLPRRATLARGGTARADLHWLGGQLAVCRALLPLFRACAGGELGEVVGVGSGIAGARTATGLWVAATAGVALRAPLGATPLRWQAGAGVAWALLRPQFGFDDVGVLHQASQASGRLWLGLVWN